MQELLQYESLTLEAVKYWHTDYLTAIQLQFKEGFETPFFGYSSSNLNQLNIDTDKQITKVGAYISRIDVPSGLQFNYSGTKKAQALWFTYYSRKWVSEKIPDGYQIVGMFGDYYDREIKNLGYNLLPIDRPPMP